MDQVQARLIRFLVRSGGDDDDRGIGDVIVSSGIDLHLTGKRDSVGDVLRLPIGFVVVDVQKDEFGKKAALHQGECGGRSDEAASDDGCFSWVDGLFHKGSLLLAQNRAEMFRVEDGFSFSFLHVQYSITGNKKPLYLQRKNQKIPERPELSMLENATLEDKW